MNDRKRIYHLTELKQRRRDLRQRSTNSEKLLWERLRNNKLGFKFRRQFSVMGYVVDFYCSQKRLAVELLGSVHKDEKVKIYDKHRKDFLKAHAIVMLEFWNREVENDIDVVVAKIRNLLSLDPSPQLWRGDARGEVETEGEVVSKSGKIGK